MGSTSGGDGVVTSGWLEGGETSPSAVIDRHVRSPQRFQSLGIQSTAGGRANRPVPRPAKEAPTVAAAAALRKPLTQSNSPSFSAAPIAGARPELPSGHHPRVTGNGQSRYTAPDFWDDIRLTVSQECNAQSHDE